MAQNPATGRLEQLQPKLYAQTKQALTSPEARYWKAFKVRPLLNLVCFAALAAERSRFGRRVGPAPAWPWPPRFPLPLALPPLRVAP